MDGDGEGPLQLVGPRGDRRGVELGVEHVEAASVEDVGQERARVDRWGASGLGRGEVVALRRLEDAAAHDRDGAAAGARQPVEVGGRQRQRGRSVGSVRRVERTPRPAGRGHDVGRAEPGPPAPRGAAHGLLDDELGLLGLRWGDHRVPDRPSRSSVAAR